MEFARSEAARAGTAVEEGFAVGAGGVRIFYQARGAGEVIILLHGFPDDHRTWAPIVPALADRYRIVTPDLRVYCRSDKPVGLEHYRLVKLIGDVVGLIDHFQQRQVILGGHDWGAAIAQAVALYHPHRVRRLILLNMPHLNGLRRELATNARQQAASWYARLFQDGQLEPPMDWSMIFRQLRGRRHRSFAMDVLRRSYLTGLMDYYRANYPHPPYQLVDDAPRRNIRVPTLIVFGLDDPFVLPACLRDNQRWFDRRLHVVTIPRAGHWVHHDAREVVLRATNDWLAQPDDSL